jgi:3-dehydroshikimate dehydratase
MIRPGLVSVTFRGLPPERVVACAASAGLEGVEWGGDVHVPPGLPAAARHAARLTSDAGLAVAAYGSYYRLGQDEPDRFRAVLDSALELGAPIIRVWAGGVGSRDASQGVRDQVAQDGRRIAAMAAAHGLRIACEWHGGTLTDTAESARSLLLAGGHPALTTYWQPRVRLAHAATLADLDAALPWLSGLHVFHWDESDQRRLPLAEGEARWRDYLARARGAMDGWALLEFVAGDAPEQMAKDAGTLRRLLDEPSGARMG